MKAVAVLGCMVSSDGRCSAQLEERVKLAVKCFEKIQEESDAILILSGYKGSGPVSEAEAAAALCCELGVRRQAIVLEMEASNTIENAIKILPLAVERGVTDMLVVTSDFHVNRSRAIFETVYQDTNIKLDFAAAKAIFSPSERANLTLQEEMKIASLPERLDAVLGKKMKRSLASTSEAFV